MNNIEQMAIGQNPVPLVYHNWTLFSLILLAIIHKELMINTDPQPNNKLGENDAAWGQTPNMNRDSRRSQALCGRRWGPKCLEYEQI